MNMDEQDGQEFFNRKTQFAWLSFPLFEISPVGAGTKLDRGDGSKLDRYMDELGSG